MKVNADERLISYGCSGHSECPQCKGSKERSHTAKAWLSPAPARFHACGTFGGHHHHRHPDRVVAAGGAGGARSREGGCNVKTISSKSAWGFSITSPALAFCRRADWPCLQGTLTGTSWWVRILPYLEGGNIIEQYDYSMGGWVYYNTRAAAILRNLQFPFMVCPSSTLPRKVLNPEVGQTGFDQNMQCPTYTGISGAADGNNTNIYSATDGTVFTAHGWTSTGGVLIMYRAIPVAEITDGLSNTMAVGEQSDWLSPAGGIPKPWTSTQQPVRVRRLPFRLRTRFHYGAVTAVAGGYSNVQCDLRVPPRSTSNRPRGMAYN